MLTIYDDDATAFMQLGGGTSLNLNFSFTKDGITPLMAASAKGT